MARYECRFAGYGGQGIILAGVVLGLAASLDGLNACQTQSYGPEARGGAARSDVVIADEEIDCLLVTKPNYLICLSQEALDKYSTNTSEDCLIIYDSGVIKDTSSIRTRNSVPIQAITTAADKFNNKLVANMIAVGYLGGITGLISLEALRESVSQSVTQKLREINIEALEFGFESGKSLRLSAK